MNLEKIGVLLVSYGSRSAAIIDALCRSQKYLVNIYVVDKQNPSTEKNNFIPQTINTKKSEKPVKRIIQNMDMRIRFNPDPFRLCLHKFSLSFRNRFNRF